MTTGIQYKGLLLSCLCLLMACAHDQESYPNASLFEDSLRIYREPLDHLSAVRRGVCPMHPSCSEYGRLAVKKHGFFIGWAMTMDRLMRCGRDELRRATAIWVNGQRKFYDPISANDRWWYSGKASEQTPSMP